MKKNKRNKTKQLNVQSAELFSVWYQSTCTFLKNNFTRLLLHTWTWSHMVRHHRTRLDMVKHHRTDILLKNYHTRSNTVLHGHTYDHTRSNKIYSYHTQTTAHSCTQSHTVAQTTAHGRKNPQLPEWPTLTNACRLSKPKCNCNFDCI